MNTHDLTPNPRPLRVLLTGCGGPAALSFYRTPGVERCEFFMADCNPLAPGLALVDAHHRVLVPRGDDPGFVDAVLAACELHDIDLVVPTVDAELLPLANARAHFDVLDVQLLLAPRAALVAALDKWLLMQACDEVGIVPRYAIIDRHFRADEVGFPFIAKPRSGSGSRGIVLVETEAQLSTLPRDGSLLAQEYLPGEEFSVDVFIGDEVESAVVRTRAVVDSGVSVVGTSRRDPELERAAIAAARRVGIRGVCNVQFRESRSGQPRLLEINPRFPGSMPLTVASGVNMPVMALAWAMGDPVPPPGAIRETAMVRVFHEVYLDPSELGRFAAPRTLPLAS